MVLSPVLTPVARYPFLKKVLALLFLAFTLSMATGAQAQTAVIESAWWSNENDSNSDGYVESAQLNWNADSTGGGAMSVFERIFYRVSGTGSWTLLRTTGGHTIVANDPEDVKYEIIALSTRNTYDFKLEVYRSGQSSPDDYQIFTGYKMGGGGGSNDRVRLFDAWWSDEVDEDHDGYVESTRLNWDPDVAAGSTNQTVFAKIYGRTAGSGSWILLDTTPDHNISGLSKTDTMAWDLIPTGEGILDFKIELYRAGQTTPDDSLDPYDVYDLGGYKIEPPSGNLPRVTIQDAWWSGEVDDDGDGYKESARLNWNPNVVSGPQTQSVVEKVYFRLTGTSSWTLIFTRSNHLITGMGTEDTSFLNINASFNTGMYDFKIEIYRKDQPNPDYTRDPVIDSSLSQYKLEIGGENSDLVTIADAWWSDEVDINGNGYKSAARLNWNPNIAAGPANQFISEKVYYKLNTESDWRLLATVSEHEVIADNDDDIQSTDIGGTEHNIWDFKIEICRAGRYTPDTTRDPFNDTDLDDYKMEAIYDDDPALIVSTPTFNPDPALVTTSPLTFTINCDTTEAVVRYTMTTNGSTPPDPTTTSTLYEGQELPAGYGTTKVKARGWKDGLRPSEIAAAAYTVIPPAATATRTLPAGYTPGAPLAVEIAVEPSPVTATWSVNDGPPAGWTVSSISDAGTWDAAAQKVKWGPYPGPTSRTLTYLATPPYFESGARSFSGTATFDAVTTAVVGDATLTPNPDDTLPQALSIACLDASPTSASTVRFAVTFSEPVSGVDAADFATFTSGTLAGTQVAGVTGGPIVFTVSVNTGSGQGQLRLDLSGSGTGIQDQGGNGLAGGFNAGQLYSIDLAPPGFSGLAASPARARVGINVLLQFTASETLGTSPTVTVNGNPAAFQARAGLGYTFHYVVKMSDAEGSATVAVRGRDRAGNTGQTSSTRVLVIDMTPPPPVTITLDGADDSGVSNSDGITKNSTALTLRGAAEAGSMVQLWDGATMLADIPAETFASPGLDVSLSEGFHGILAIATDAAGNQSPISQGLQIRVDMTAPTAGTASAPPATKIGPIRVDYLGAGDTGGGLRHVELWSKKDSGAWLDSGLKGAAASGGFDFAPSGEGTYAFALVGEDLAGNRSAAPGGAGGAQTIFDATMPQTLSITRLDASPTSASTVHFAVTFSEPVSGVDAGDFSPFTSGTLSGTQVTGVSGGPAVYTVAVHPGLGLGQLWLDLNGSGTAIQDLAGNALSGGFSEGEFYRIDTVPPGVSGLSALPSSAKLGTTVTLGFSVSEALPTSPTMTVNGRPAPIQAHAGLDYICQYVIQVADSDGPATVTVSCADRIGNPGTVSSTTILRVDKTPPPAPVALALASADDSGVSNSDGITTRSGLRVRGTAEDGSRVELREGSTLLTSGTAAAFASPGLNISLGEGSHTLNAIATDAAGNSSGVSSSLIVRVDKSVPTAGTASAPATTKTSPIRVTYSGARDVGAGLRHVELWFKKGTGAWQDSGLRAAAASGGFDFAPSSQTTYAFALVAEDLAGNRSAKPSGAGDASTFFDATPPAFNSLSASPNPARQGVSVLLQFTASEALGTSPTVKVNGRAATLTGRTGLTYFASYTVQAADADGPAAVAVTATDLAGNQVSATLASTLKIDKLAPNSSVLATSGAASPGVLTLRWASADPASNGYASGVKTVEIYWRRNDGMVLLLGSYAPGVTSASFNMQQNGGYAKYSFYAVAADQAGNVEAAPAVADWSYRWSNPLNAAAPQWRQYE